MLVVSNFACKIQAIRCITTVSQGFLSTIADYSLSGFYEIILNSAFGLISRVFLPADGDLTSPGLFCGDAWRIIAEVSEGMPAKPENI